MNAHCPSEVGELTEMKQSVLLGGQHWMQIQVLTGLPEGNSYPAGVISLGKAY